MAVNRLGLASGTSAVAGIAGEADGQAQWALFKKNYMGEVLTSYTSEYKLDGRITTRDIDSGKSAAFPNIGTIGSEYHVPGTEIGGLAVESNETILTLDPMLISHAFIASIDEAMIHYDVRSEYSSQQGRELAMKRQLNELRCAIQAARVTTPKVQGQPGGAVIKNTTMGTDATVLAGAIRSARQIFDEKNFTDNSDEYSVALAPAQYYLLTSNKDLINRDFNPNVRGSLNDATLESVARLPLVKINVMPTETVAGGQAAGVLAKYQGDYSNTVGVIFHRSAVGTLKLMDLQLEDIYIGQKQGTLMLSKFALGHGVLRPAGAIELSKAP